MRRETNGGANAHVVYLELVLGPGDFLRVGNMEILHMGGDGGFPNGSQYGQSLVFGCHCLHSPDLRFVGASHANGMRCNPPGRAAALRI